MVNGLYDIGLTMQIGPKIRHYEDQMVVETPWIGDSGSLTRGKRDRPAKVNSVPVPKTNRGEEEREPLEWQKARCRE